MTAYEKGPRRETGTLSENGWSANTKDTPSGVSVNRSDDAFRRINDMPLMDAALAWAALGFKVFPLSPESKIPFKGSHGHLDATGDAGQIRAWWTDAPDANIGIACSASGVYAVDTDPRHGGERIPPDVPTLAQSTPGGGTHDVFSASALNGHKLYGQMDGDKDCGIDVKYNGFIIAAPSRVPGTHDDRYRVTASVPPAPSPAMDARVIKRAPVATVPDADAFLDAGRTALLEPIKMGDRDNGLRDRAYRLSCTGMSRADGIEILHEVIRKSELAQPDEPAWNYADTDPGHLWDTAQSRRTVEALPALMGDPMEGEPLEVKNELARMLHRDRAQTLLARVKASQRAESSMTVSDALDAVLSGATVDTPTVGLIDGHAHGMGLFYPGHVNGIYGDMSVAKTVMMAEVQARTLSEGGIVVHWEYDNNPMITIVKRLINAGAKPEDIRGRFHVLYSASDRDALTGDVKRAVKLVTLDALNPAVVAFGLDPYHPGGPDTVIQECFKPFTMHGACGVLIDHVGHDNKERQAGSIRKAQAIQGALYEARMDTPLKPGTTGRTRLILRKDNTGALGDMVGCSVADAVMESKAAPGDPAGAVVTVFETSDGRPRVRDEDYIDTTVPEGTPAKNRIWTVLRRVYADQKFTRDQAKALLAKEKDPIPLKTFLNKWGELVKERRLVNVPTASDTASAYFTARAFWDQPMGSLPGDSQQVKDSS